MNVKPPGTEEWHGTLSGYKTHGCRCQWCRSIVSNGNKDRHEEFKIWLAKLKGQPCADCGGSFPTVCMDLDHRDPSTKLFTISGSATRSWKTLIAEAAKCDVICSNCHRLRTAAQATAGILTPGRPNHTAMTPPPEPPCDADGTPLTVGARVQQLDAHEPRAGATKGNARRFGTVEGLGRTRAVVRFDGAMGIRNFIRDPNEPIAHRVRADLLRLQPFAGEGEGDS